MKRDDRLTTNIYGCLSGINRSHQAISQTRQLQGKVKYRPSYIPELDLTQLFFDDPTNIMIELNFEGEQLLDK